MSRARREPSTAKPRARRNPPDKRALNQATEEEFEREGLGIAPKE